MRTLVASRGLRIGKQGEFLVLAELVRRGLMPYAPVLDDHGVDIMLYNGVHIQVKSANLVRSNSKSKRRPNVYQFSCALNVSGPGARKRAAKAHRRTFGNACDFVILVGLDEQRFWIIPAEVADSHGKTCFALGQKKYPSAHEVNELRAEGKSYEDIATILDSNIAVVYDRHKRGDMKKGAIMRELRAYEDRWDLLELKPQHAARLISLPTIYERDPDFIASIAGPIAA